MRTNYSALFKWVIYYLILVGLFVLQSTPGFLSVFGIRPVLILSYAIFVSMYEGELYGSIFGAVAGLLWDMGGSSVSGYKALLMLVICCCVSLFTLHLVRNNVFSAAIFTSIAISIVFLLDFFFYYGLWGYDGSAQMILKNIIPTMVASVIFSLPIYYLVRKINRSFSFA